MIKIRFVIIELAIKIVFTEMLQYQALDTNKDNRHAWRLSDL